MAASVTTRTAPLGATTAFRLSAALDNMMAGFAAWNDARVTRNALHRLSDRELDDIGLSRGDIDAVARAR
jgi:uncharacterized protein YjiS (DUF1127 family)